MTSTSPPLMVNTLDPASTPDMPAESLALLARRRAVMGNAMLFYERPIHVERASGVRLYDADGQAYLDVYNNVPSVGHCHPAVVDAVSRQMARLNIHTRYLSDVVVDYAERLVSAFPAPLDRVVFNNSGSEAADLCLRIARNITGGTGIVVTANAYHGLSAAIAEISPSLGARVPLGAHVRVVAAPVSAATGADVGEVFAEDIAAAIVDLQRHGIRTAALFADTIFSSDGVMCDPAGFLRGAVDVVRAAGGLFVADEVQPGFGRTGGHMWGFARHGVVPDLVMLGKPMGNGLPMAAAVMPAATLDTFNRTSRYASTFGGNPVCAAAGLAVLDVIRDERLMDNALIVGSHMAGELRGLAARHPAIADVRGAGLFLGVDFARDGQPDPATALRTVSRLRDRHVLIGASGVMGHSLKIRPPLPFSIADADEFLDKFDASLA